MNDWVKNTNLKAVQWATDDPQIFALEVTDNIQGLTITKQFVRERTGGSNISQIILRFFS